jgi:hypothetical protein
MTRCWRFPACSLRSAQSPQPLEAASGFESGRSPARQAGAPQPASALPRSRLEAEARTKARRWAKIFLSPAPGSPLAQYNPGGATRPIASRMLPASFQERVFTCLICCLRRGLVWIYVSAKREDWSDFKAPPFRKVREEGGAPFRSLIHTAEDGWSITSERIEIRRCCLRRSRC